MLIYEDTKNPEWLFSTSMSVEGKYLMLATSKSAADIQLRHYVDLTGVTLDKKLEFKPIIADWIGGFSFIHNIGTKFFFKTNYNAPMGKVISIDISQPAKENWKDVIPEAHDVMSTIGCYNNKFLVNYMVNASDTMMVFDMPKESEQAKFLTQLELPGIGTVGKVNGAWDEKELFYGFTSFSHPMTAMKVDLDTF